MRRILLCFVVACMASVSLAEDAQAQTTECWSSWYGPGFYGNLTASGEVYTGTEYTAASPYLPFGTVVYVENQWTGSGAYVRINDRGPYVWGRCIDLSYASAWVVDYGVAPVWVEVVY